MKILIVLAVAVAFGVLRYRRANLLIWAAAWWAGIYILLRFGFAAPIPSSVISMYMGIVTLAILAYVSSSQQRRTEVSRPIVRFLTERRFAPLLAAVAVAIPVLAAANVYVSMNVPVEPPLFSRTVHPASPADITVHDKRIDLDAGGNPFRGLERSNPQEFRQHVEDGRRVYYQNCVFCHGDNMSANGMFAHGLDPIPTNFHDTIPQLRETFLMWRVSKGGPGLPDEGGPWDTAMPAWEKFLKEEEMWNVILFLYDFTGTRPRGREEIKTAGFTFNSERAEAQAPTDAKYASGRTLYSKYCSQCHGEKGDGEGYAAVHLRPRPRNFTTAKFKIRTTPNGALPTHDDLVNIIRRGMPYTSMPAWPNFTNKEVSDLADFVTTFSSEFSNPANAPKPVPFPRAPRSTKDSIELGKKLYADTGCVKCHGTFGRGDGPSAPTLVDDWGRPIRPADLAQDWTFRGGAEREDIFRTLSTGLNGTPMPSFLDALKPEERWAITDYIDSLSGSGGPAYTNIVIAKHVDDQIDLARGTANFESARVARFPIIGQITEPTREFHPPATSVMVRAVYDADSIALLVQWHDMSADKAGKNGPSLPVPREEEEEPAQAAPSAQAGAQPSPTNPFGEAEVTPAPPAPKPQQKPQNPFEEEAAPAAPASEFSDALAVQIPSQPPAGARKPYFIFGDSQNSVDLWFYDLARPTLQQFIGKGSADIAANDAGDVTGTAKYDQGQWSVIFKRPLHVDSGASFSPGQFMPVAFSVWDGFSRERGSRRGLTVWYSLYLGPETTPSVVGPMIQTALLFLVLELVVIGWVRWRYASRARRDESREPVPDRA